MDNILKLRNNRRILNVCLPQWESDFLWGSRKVGKSTYLKTSELKGTETEFQCNNSGSGQRPDLSHIVR